MKLEARGLRCGYDRQMVVDSFSFTFQPNRLYILMGKNGSGKTTLLNTLGGWLKALSGDVLCSNENLHALPARKRAHFCGRIAGQTNNLTLTVGRFVLLGAYAKTAGHYSKPVQRQAEEAMEQMGIADLKNKAMDRISAGQRQKAAVAQILVQDPVCLFLDEPGANLDPQARFELMNMLRDLCSPDRIVIAVLHDLDLALRYGDELLVLDDHHLVYAGEPKSFLESGILESVFSIKACDFQEETRTARFFLLDEVRQNQSVTEDS